MTLVECIALATETVRRTRLAGVLSTADRSSVAHVAAWEAFEAGATPGLVVRITRRRIVDEVRVEFGKTGARNVDRVPVEDWHCTSSDGDGVEFAALVDAIACGDPRTVSVLRRVACGERKRDIAAAVGVHPSRVTQILKAARRPALLALST